MNPSVQSQTASEQTLTPDVSSEPALSELLASVDSEAGRLRVLKGITSGPYPRYHAMPGVEGLLLRTEADGKQTLGRFFGREFREIE